ncbi:serine/threonine-protein phosphatase 6 regulatory ankyrin repeat subunit B-like protein [Cinnamomum micranthum f. kanehirae]|uniref:Serine/threonine-protein phosphatase 6 regulatory ankyrin repeat subunit B-like protein n=1 Tax=Cinnamomum micranthum f. kanehirae TaxID=337451 RepID=A0A3S3NM20_9MAGN|nr:serine/threonine-protein phosphatase 6 regulatory ankyrin repeat subunit B-like protein [Cinnamomum micranthum f. kanehirae]
MKEKSPFLVATKMGVTEMVVETLGKFLVAVEDMNQEKKNAVLLAVENRQPNVYHYLWESRRGTYCNSAFASTTTLPGGVKQEEGTPVFEGEPSFDMFAISSLVALCFSITFETTFLSILTSHYQV